MKLIKRLFCLRFFSTMFIAVPSFIFVIYTLTNKSIHPIVTYISYGLSAYALIILTTLIVRIMMMTKGNAKNLPAIQKLYQIPAAEKYMTDRIFRAKVNLYGGLLINLGYVVMNGISGIQQKSEWPITLAIYYFILSAMRYALLHHFNRKPIGKALISEFKRYRLCGILLLFMNGALAAMVARILNDNEGYHYGGMMIYAMALYTFYSVTMAVVNLVRFRKFGSPVLSAIKAVSLTSALVSMLSLETAMLEQFGAKDGEHFRRLMTSLTGGGICIIEIGIAIFMIVRAAKSIHRLEQSNETK